MGSALGIRDYNEYNWRHLEVHGVGSKPKGHHFAGVIFDTYYSDSGYSVAEGGGSCPHPYARYYAFPNQDTLEQWVTEAANSKKEFFCFRAQMAEARVRVSVEF